MNRLRPGEAGATDDGLRRRENPLFVTKALQSLEWPLRGRAHRPQPSPVCVPTRRLTGKLTTAHAAMSPPLLFALGCCAGAALAAGHFRPRLSALRARADEAERQSADAAAAGAKLAEMQAQLSLLRHDLNGILSPALLTAGRLTSSEDPSIKRAGEVMVRTVERAAERLASMRAACQ